MKEVDKSGDHHIGGASGTSKSWVRAGSPPNCPPVLVGMGNLASTAPSCPLPRWQSLRQDMWGREESFKPRALSVVCLAREGTWDQDLTTKFNS